MTSLANAPAPAGATRRRRRNLTLTIGIVVTAAFIAIALASFVYLPHNPNVPRIPDRLLPVGSPGYPLGTDALGRDIFSQLMVGARTSLVVGAGAAFISLLVGTVAGLSAAAFGRLADEAISRSADIMLSIPGMVTALVLAATIGSGALTTVLALSAFFTPSFTRVIRSAALSVMQEDFVIAARLYGRPTWFILLRHALPNVAGVIIVQFTLYFAAGILTEAGLSYLGVGVTRPSISWGMMLNEAQQQVGISSPLAMWPGLAIVIVVLGLNLLGDGLRDVLDPKLAGRSS
jgi:peptide/nickel transport system permease protein